jgi:hypothetical protein
MIPEIAYSDNPQPKTAPTPEVKTEPKKDLSKPENVAKEDAIVKVYNSKFAGLKAGALVLTDEMLGKFTYGFEQDKIILRTNQRLETPLFAALARKVEGELGGKYISGKGSHFILPYL